MPLTLPGCHVEMNAEGYLVLQPSQEGGVNRAGFQQVITRFLNDNRDYELVGKPHRSNQDGLMDLVILRPPASRR